MTRLDHIRNNWKLIIHLLLRTKRFGVNNQWWSDFDGYFGWPWYKILISLITIKPIIKNYKGMRFRSLIGFISREHFKEIWNFNKLIRRLKNGKKNHCDPPWDISC